MGASLLHWSMPRDLELLEAEQDGLQHDMPLSLLSAGDVPGAHEPAGHPKVLSPTLLQQRKYRPLSQNDLESASAVSPVALGSPQHEKPLRKYRPLSQNDLESASAVAEGDGVCSRYLGFGGARQTQPLIDIDFLNLLNHLWLPRRCIDF